MWQRGLIGRTASARVPSHKRSAFTSRREQLKSVSSTRKRSVDICSRLLPLDESGWDLYLASISTHVPDSPFGPGTFDLSLSTLTVWDPEGVILEGMLLNVVGSKPEGIVSADEAENIESLESGTVLLDEDDETDILLDVEVVVVNKVVGWDSVTGIEEVNGKRRA
ncbi:hypothetical protein TNCV_5102401 [Trichonephila clavipes]|nr:hypothetical protein TNCV_5102401 [Trichonephila clavipes]